MSELQDTQDIDPAEESALPAKMVFTLAAGAGLSVASIYYCQPMLSMMGPGLNATLTETGMVPTLTQIGYALGILLLIPLGDSFDRRRIILFKSLLLTLAADWCGPCAKYS